ncbi:hypothetical protein RHGRI_025001 [Rhododendron griersonianum]|uniref:RING-type E3 ubiquitin transferase (cysteine targeting) n=1 Tax=Rhododendron griersonianum TaxID=479676 RepID=A0AAV6JD13_9ERIC|nr:hypothetical protein RHGRI_025001 [Rhododendron griersonianum]
MQRETLASSSTSSSSYNNPPPQDAWVDTYLRLLPHWQSLTPSNQPIIPISISRVNQVDAHRLDIEMSAMLKEQLVNVFSLMKPGFLFQYEPELDAFLEFLIWRFSIWVDKPTPGNALMNLRYRDERAIGLGGKVRTGLEGPGLTVGQKLWYCVATVGGQYIWARLQSFSAFRRWGDSEQRSVARRAWTLIERIEGIYKAASFGNLLIFLYTGRYRNLVERALKARLVYGSPHMNRSVSFEYMNRQLVWNEFSEMLLLLLPLLNSSSIKNFLHPFSKDKSSSSGGDETLCPICLVTPTVPFLALPCQHSYCYYCLRTRCSAAQSFRCTRCNEPVIAMQRGGLASEEEAHDNKFGGGSHFQLKRLENWQDQQQQLQQQILINPSLLRVPVFDIKQEDAHSSQVYGTHRNVADEFQTSSRPNSWSQVVMGVSSSPSTAAGGASKKARVHSTPTLPPLKTDTASVLLEAIGYIGFLQGQIEALSSPYLGNASANMRHQQSVEGERNCTFQEDYGQGKEFDEPRDLRSRGLCLVPISCTQHVGSENGADYWAPSLGGGF